MVGVCGRRWDGQFREGGAASSSGPPPVDSLTTAELKQELLARGCKTNGSKDVLKARLQEIYNKTYGATSKQK